MDFYNGTKGQKPKRVIFFRDGVGESMFKQVRSFEIAKIQEACLEMPGGNYRPAITFVVVQKRNQTRYVCSTPAGVWLERSQD